MSALPATLTVVQARGVRDALVRAAGAETAAVVVDATALSHFDSAALAVLLDLRRTAEAAGRPFRVEGAPAKLMSLATVYGLHDLLFVKPAAGAAIAA